MPIQEKRLLGSWYGGANVHHDFPRLLALYRAGKLKLDELPSGREGPEPPASQAEVSPKPQRS